MKYTEGRMKTITYAGAIVLPNRESIFLYEVDSEIRKFLSTVVDANVTKKSIDDSMNKISTEFGLKPGDVKEFSFNKTAMLMLKSFQELADLGVVNLNEIVNMNSQYEEVTKLKAIRAELSAFRSTPYSDIIIPINVKIDSAYIIQIMLVIIYAPIDWAEKNASIAFADQQALEQSEKIKERNSRGTKQPVKEDVAPPLGATESLSSFVMRKGVGSSRSGTIESLRQASSTVHPFEMNVINSAVAGLKKMVSNKTEVMINDQNAIRFMDIKDFISANQEVNVANDGDRFTYQDNHLTIRTTSLTEITNTEYIQRVKNDEPLKYDSSSFEVTNKDALLIYAPPGAGKTEFIIENNLTLLVLDTDYSMKQLQAEVIITNRHELIPKFNKSCALIYAEVDWKASVRSKLGGETDTIDPAWYGDMLKNAEQATYKIKASRGKYVANYITVVNGIDKKLKEVIITPSQVQEAQSKAAAITDDDKNDPSTEQKKLTKKITESASGDPELTEEDKSKIVRDMSTPAAIGKGNLKNKSKNASNLKKGTDAFFK